ncbi:hypothetical protein BF93_00655 [Brachybacterium phenoliresistens]|uniref:Proteinase inhibitor I42 chagasin domain-containing protein n=1 Tax=Brachybacterium phenoliresistens TaxID=396014 RepID=Z9JSL6_9MICO|nr:hypothetical protein [Brachybacterium phenoliresistens]EWS81003.1 hypothetical protein BF93_00655 [Brachybacterium phenoliresistens]
MTRCASRRRPTAVLAGLALAAVLAACGAPEHGVLLEQGTTEVDLAVGESAQISLGEGSQGVGDAWGVVSETDSAVASAEVVMDEEVHGTEQGEDAPGATMPYAVEVTGLAPGTTTVRVLYCTRSEIAEDCDQSQGTLEPPVDPVEITVTVR